MPLNSTDLFVVQRGNSLYRVPSSTLKTDYAASPTVFVGENPPPGTPTQGQLWWSTAEGNLFIWYQDGNSNQWVDASPAFVELAYDRIEAYINQYVNDNAVLQINAGQYIYIDPADGKGSVTINADLSSVELAIEQLEDFVTVDQQRQDDALNAYKLEVAADQQRQDDEIARLEGIIKDLADRLDQLEDKVDNVVTIDGGYPNAQGIFDEPDTDAGTADPASMTGTPIDGGDAEDLLN